MSKAKGKTRAKGNGKDATILWFRADLRLADNPALLAAVSRGGPVAPVFIWSPDEEGDWRPGAASNWWLHQSLSALARDLEAKGSRLVIRRGPTGEALTRLVKETNARAVFWNRRYEPDVRERDEELASMLGSEGVEVATFNAALLAEPGEIETKQGKPFRVFTPFWKACLNHEAPDEPLEAPRRIRRLEKRVDSLLVESLELEPKIDWAAGIRAAWTPGESGAWDRLTAFLDGAIGEYDEERDRPDHDGTSRLSPHLHFGEISPRQVWHAVQSGAGVGRTGRTERSSEAFLRQLYWREFAYHLLYHEPQTTDRPLRPEFAGFPWASDKKALRAWQRGRTGFPYIDAGMRQLWTTGWMHNRVRMAVASFLVKDLLLPWQEGAKWFWDTLVDADLANNTLGWQWTAGCGADAAPYFRVFNPMTQGERFDPDGAYVREWVPEVAALPGKYVHRPWEAPKDVLEEAGIVLGETYPQPMVDHRQARQAALAAFETLKRGAE